MDVITFIASYNNQDHELANSGLEAEINLFQILVTSI